MSSKSSDTARKHQQLFSDTVLTASSRKPSPNVGKKTSSEPTLRIKKRKSRKVSKTMQEDADVTLLDDSSTSNNLPDFQSQFMDDEKQIERTSSANTSMTLKSSEALFNDLIEAKVNEYLAEHQPDFQTLLEEFETIEEINMVEDLTNLDAKESGSSSKITIPENVKETGVKPNIPFKSTQFQFLTLREKVKKLLITDNNEVDLERLMALHFLSILPAKHCVGRRLSEPNQAARLTRYTDILPTYMFINNEITECRCFDGKKTKLFHIFVRSDVESFLHTVMEAIKKSNSDKLEYLWTRAYNTRYVSSLLLKEDFRALMRSMMYHLKSIVNDKVKMRVCKVVKASLYNVTMRERYMKNKVSFVWFPDEFINDLFTDSREVYYSDILAITSSLNTDIRYIPYIKGLCVLQNPKKPAGIALISENGMYIVAINGPQFCRSDANDFNNIAIYVFYQVCNTNYQIEWEEVCKKAEDNSDSVTDQPGSSNESTLGKSAVAVIKKLLDSMTYDEKNMMAKKWKDVIRSEALNPKAVPVPYANLFKKVLSVNKILQVLGTLTLLEREVAMKSIDRNGLGFAHAIFGKKIINLFKEICSNSVEQLEIFPIHNITPTDNEMNELRFRIPKDLDEIYQEVFDYENYRASVDFFKHFNKQKTFKL